jgi:hypothetical protein
MNFSGVSQFYRGTPSRSYVVEVGLSSSIRGDILQEAVNATLRRMPYCADALVERNGNFYYATNPLPFEVTETQQLRRVGGAQTNWHCLDVTYWNDTVWFSMFHGFCDGLGLNLFIEATLYNYFCIRDGKQYAVEGIRTPDSPVLPGEEKDAFAFVYDLPENFNVNFFGEKYLHLPEIDEKPLDYMYGVPVRVKEDEFMRFVKENKSTPVAMLHVLLANAVQTVHPENDQTVGALVPASYRKHLGADNTFKNCSGALRLPYRMAEMRGLSFAEQAQRSRALLKQANDPNPAKFLANRMGGALRQMSTAIPTFAGRLPYLDFQKTANNDTYMIDYVGGLKAGEYGREILRTKYMATNIDRNFSTVTLYISATGGFFHFEIVRAFDSGVYVDAFLEQLSRQGIAYVREPESRYVTPENGLIKDLGLL